MHGTSCLFTLIYYGAGNDSTSPFLTVQGTEQSNKNAKKKKKTLIQVLNTYARQLYHSKRLSALPEHPVLDYEKRGLEPILDTLFTA